VFKYIYLSFLIFTVVIKYYAEVRIPYYENIQMGWLEPNPDKLISSKFSTKSTSWSKSKKPFNFTKKKLPNL